MPSGKTSCSRRTNTSKRSAKEDPSTVAKAMSRRPKRAAKVRYDPYKFEEDAQLQLAIRLSLKTQKSAEFSPMHDDTREIPTKQTGNEEKEDTSTDRTKTISKLVPKPSQKPVDNKPSQKPLHSKPQKPLHSKPSQKPFHSKPSQKPLPVTRISEDTDRSVTSNKRQNPLNATTKSLAKRVKQEKKEKKLVCKKVEATETPTTASFIKYILESDSKNRDMELVQLFKKPEPEPEPVDEVGVSSNEQATISTATEVCDEVIKTECDNTYI